MLAAVAIEAGLAAGLPEGAMSLVAGGGRGELASSPRRSGVVDLIIPRGGEGLKAALKGVATVPVIYAASGNCHVYVDATAPISTTRRRSSSTRSSSVPASATPPRRCSCTTAIAAEFLPAALSALAGAGVELHGDERARGVRGRCPRRCGDRGGLGHRVPRAELAVGVVDSTEEAIEHINAHGSGHSEAIVTRDTESARAFQLGVDAACVYVNASTRFTDGGEFGMGAEIGNSTQKLHARGPIGLRELCTFKYLVEGSGHVRA